MRECELQAELPALSSNSEHVIVTQWVMGDLEKVGMLKMDMLGLKTLTVIHDAVAMIRDRHGAAPDMDALDLADPEVYALLRRGRTGGIFQFESPLATDMLRNMKCDRFDDLVAEDGDIDGARGLARSEGERVVGAGVIEIGA